MEDGDNMIEPIKRLAPGQFNQPQIEPTDDSEEYLPHDEASEAADALGIDG